MSIQTELTRLTNAKAAIKAAIAGKGVTVPDATLLDGMAALIESIDSGGGVVTGTFTTTDDITSNIVITHNLGVKPKFIIVVCVSDGYDTAKPLLLTFFYIVKFPNGFVGARWQAPNISSVKYGVESNDSLSATSTSGMWYYINYDETTFTLNQSAISSHYGIGANNTFFWLAMKGE